MLQLTLWIQSPIDISQVYNSHLKDYGGRFTDAVIQRIREMLEVAYIKQDTIAYASDTQHFASCVHSSNLPWPCYWY